MIDETDPRCHGAVTRDSDGVYHAWRDTRATIWICSRSTYRECLDVLLQDWEEQRQQMDALERDEEMAEPVPESMQTEGLCGCSAEDGDGDPQDAAEIPEGEVVDERGLELQMEMFDAD